MQPNYILKIWQYSSSFLAFVFAFLQCLSVPTSEDSLLGEQNKAADFEK